jgi:rhamnosyltransferase subunit B
MADFPVFEASSSTELSAEISAFLAKGEKPLVFTAGTANFHADKFFATALQACKQVGLRGIFLTKDRTQIPAQLPDSILWQAYVPLAKLLPHAAAIIHHGGIGTAAEALRAGTPQLITPFAWDQFDNGARIKALGVGMTISAKKLNVHKLTRALQQLCDSNTILAQCKHVAAQFKSSPDLGKICRDIERQLEKN